MFLHVKVACVRCHALAVWEAFHLTNHLLDELISNKKIKSTEPAHILIREDLTATGADVPTALICPTSTNTCDNYSGVLNSRLRVI